MKGKPVRGAIGGFFFGLFLIFDLIFLKVVESDATALLALPIVFLIVGLGLAAWAPLGRNKATATTEPPTPSPEGT